MSELVILMCPPLSDYPEQPEDHSKCEPFDCPKCGNKMWLSEKKKGVLLFSSLLNREIVLGCYPCITKYASDNRELFLDAEQVNL